MFTESIVTLCPQHHSRDGAGYHYTEHIPLQYLNCLNVLYIRVLSTSSGSRSCHISVHIRTRWKYINIFAEQDKIPREAWRKTTATRFDVHSPQKVPEKYRPRIISEKIRPHQRQKNIEQKKKHPPTFATVPCR